MSETTGVLPSACYVGQGSSCAASLKMRYVRAALVCGSRLLSVRRHHGTDAITPKGQIPRQFIRHNDSTHGDAGLTGCALKLTNMCFLVRRLSCSGSASIRMTCCFGLSIPEDDDSNSHQKQDSTSIRIRRPKQRRFENGDHRQPRQPCVSTGERRLISLSS